METYRFLAKTNPEHTNLLSIHVSPDMRENISDSINSRNRYPMNRQRARLQDKDIAMSSVCKTFEEYNTVDNQNHDLPNTKPEDRNVYTKRENLAIIGGAVDMRKQALVVATWKMVALENSLLPQHGSISLLNYLFRLLRYQHAYHQFMCEAPPFSPKRNQKSSIHSFSGARRWRKIVVDE